MLCHIVVTMLLANSQGQEFTLKVPVQAEDDMKRKLTAKDVLEEYAKNPKSVQQVVHPLVVKAFTADNVPEEDCATLAKRLNPK